MAATPYQSSTSVKQIIGGSASELVGMHGVACAQAATIAAVATTAATTTSPYGFTGTAQFNALVAAVNDITTALKDKGIIASA